VQQAQASLVLAKHPLAPQHPTAVAFCPQSVQPQHLAAVHSVAEAPQLAVH